MQLLEDVEGKEFAKHLIRGKPKHSFAMLLSYYHALKEVNPDMVTHIEVDSNNKFNYFFMTLGAAVRVFTFMIKVISVEEAWIKTQHKRVLVVAATQDNEYHSYPIAWGVVDSENNASWAWFFEKLKELIPDDPEFASFFIEI